jgi:hypothetical protein
MFKLKPDFEQVLTRYEAWWDCEIVDRPLVSMGFMKPSSEWVDAPTKTHPSWRARWMDTAYVVEQTAAALHNRIAYADALPIAWPNLGPEVFSAFYGCPLEFGETTSWSEPILTQWDPEAVALLRLDTGNLYYRKILELMDGLIEVGKGQFIVGYTDLHPGGDAIAAFRDPQSLCLDMVEHPDEVKALCERITDDFITVYDAYHEKLVVAGMPSTTWLPATCRGRTHVPSNDFSCMISNRMFEEVFLPGIVRECRHMDRNIYHLDGPQALRFLDTLLSIPEIHAIQWVPGAGRDHWALWIEVYQRIQAANKAFCLSVAVQELDDVMAVLRPEGAWLMVSGVTDVEMADKALRRIARWAR